MNPRATRPSRAPSARGIVRRLLAVRDPGRAALAQRYFRTDPGGYGEGDRFLGLTAPMVRRFARELRGAPVATITELLASPWHEARLLALFLLVEHYRRGDDSERRAVYAAYLRLRVHVNGWDLVDASAPTIVGEHLVARSRAPLLRLARSRRVWDRRIAILATAAFIRRGDHADTFRLARLLLRDEHDLIHKAVGWMLREVGKRDHRALERFLDRHATAMPRTMLRYAIERLPAATRRRYLGARSTRTSAAARA